jgi:hypothetical protein
VRYRSFSRPATPVDRPVSIALAAHSGTGIDDQFVIVWTANRQEVKHADFDVFASHSDCVREFC